MNQETEKKEAPEEQPHPFAWGVSGWGTAALGSGLPDSPTEPGQGVGVDPVGATKQED